jgi:hypothetical protein
LISEPPEAQPDTDIDSKKRLKEMISRFDQDGEGDENVLLEVMKTARSFDTEFSTHYSRNFFTFLLDSNLAPYVLYLHESVVPDLHVPFESVIDHHFSWDQKGSWIVYFKNLYKHLSSRKAQLLHAAIKIINISKNYTGSDERLRQMVTNHRSDIWINVDRALETAIATAKSHDEYYQSKQVLLVNLDLVPFALYLYDAVVPDLHIPFDLVVRHHLAWDNTGHWINFFQELFQRLPDFEAQLLHAALKIITLPETFPGSQKRRLETTIASRPDLERSKIRALQLSPVTPMLKSPRQARAPLSLSPSSVLISLVVV